MSFIADQLKALSSWNMACVGLLMLLASATSFAAETNAEPSYLPPEDYGKVDLPRRQSIGSAMAFVKKHGHAFEPVSQLRSDDTLFRIARAVGRLDLLLEVNGKLSASTCTAVLISDTHVLTNHHCVGKKEHTIKKASILFNYLRQHGKGAFRIELETIPVQTDERLDYAIVLLKNRIDTIAPMPMMARRVEPKSRLRVIHHPAGLPKMMTQFKCRVASSHQPADPYIRHVCDTLPGSSGAVIMDPDSTTMVGLHHSGGLTENDPASFNVATSVLSLAAHSSIIRSVVQKTATVAGGKAPLATPVSSKPSVSKPTANEAAKGGAAAINQLIDQDKGN